MVERENNFDNQPGDDGNAAAKRGSLARLDSFAQLIVGCIHYPIYEAQPWEGTSVAADMDRGLRRPNHADVAPSVNSPSDSLERFKIAAFEKAFTRRSAKGAVERPNTPWRASGFTLDNRFLSGLQPPDIRSTRKTGKHGGRAWT